MEKKCRGWDGIELGGIEWNNEVGWDRREWNGVRQDGTVEDGMGDTGHPAWRTAGLHAPPITHRPPLGWGQGPLPRSLSAVRGRFPFKSPIPRVTAGWGALPALHLPL